MGIQDMAIDGNTVTTLIAIGGPIGAVFTLGWWLSGRFRKAENAQRDRIDELATNQRDRVDELAAAHREQLDAHETRDQERHDENLERFRTISVSLAKLGASNGSARGA